MSSTKAPDEIYGNILSFLSPEDALNIVKNNTKLALVALRYYPWDLSDHSVCDIFSDADIETLKYNTNISQDSLFQCVVSKGILVLTKKLLQTGKISLLAKNEALSLTTEPSLVEELLKDPKIDPNYIYKLYIDSDTPRNSIIYHPLADASITNYNTLKILLNYPRKYPERKISYHRDIYVYILNNVSFDGDLSTVKLIEKYMPIGNAYSKALDISVIRGSRDIFDFLLNSRKILLTDIEHIIPLIFSISSHNRVKALKKILKDPRFNDYVYYGMVAGISDGKIDIVREMLKYFRIKGDDVDLYRSDDRSPFTMAIKHYYNHPKEILLIIKLLLKDGRADPSLNNNEYIIDASSYGYLEVVKLLLKDSRVDPSARDYASINEAYVDERYTNKKSSSDIIKLLANHPKVKYNRSVPTKTLNQIYFTLID